MYFRRTYLREIVYYIQGDISGGIYLNSLNMNHLGYQNKASERMVIGLWCRESLHKQMQRRLTLIINTHLHVHGHHHLKSMRRNYKVSPNGSFHILF